MFANKKSLLVTSPSNDGAIQAAPFLRTNGCIGWILLALLVRQAIHNCTFAQKNGYNHGHLRQKKTAHLLAFQVKQRMVPLQCAMIKHPLLLILMNHRRIIR